MKFYLLNVFCRDMRHGNQLAVVFPDAAVSDAQMQEIALNFGFSETVFVSQNQYLRIFSPGGELPFAGHPTIGSAWAVGKRTNNLSFALETLRGIVAVRVTGETAQFKFPGEPSFSEYTGQINQILSDCYLSTTQVDMDKIKVVNTGPEFLVIPVKTHEALMKATPLTQMPGSARPYLVFRESTDKFHVRMFSPNLNGGEDAATGSAACALAGYLYQMNNEDLGMITIYQGKELGRPSEIKVSWEKQNIYVSGSVVRWAEGQLT